MSLIPNILTNNETNRVKHWFKENYRAYPSGIQGFNRRSYENVVTLQLSDPLDTDIFEDVINEEGYELKIDSDEQPDGLWAGIYETEPNPNGGVGERLVGALSFDKEREVAIGRDPVDYEGNANDYRLPLLKEYLEERYS